MGRRAAAVDRNQPEIVQALRKAGATVQHLHTVGQGCPDILVGFRGCNLLYEIKDGEAIPSKQKLTGPEKDWHDLWRGEVHIVRSADEAIEVMYSRSQGVELRGIVR